MATAVSISTHREEVVVSYPSEPILALASRLYTNGVNLQPFFQCMKESIPAGAVPKGHRGEVIVRLLNLFAMDKCAARSESYATPEVTLREFLSKFDRQGSSIVPLLEGKITLDEKAQKRLKREIGEKNVKAAIKALEETSGSYQKLLDGGTVCFNHFIYVEKKAKSEAIITPDLLRLAYRRQAAIVVEEGRRGIDWVIPVRLQPTVTPAKPDDDSFVGLVGQDKNRIHDSVTGLASLSNDETHVKVSPSYFLSQCEREAFEEIGWSLDWPSILFSIGVDDIAASTAQQPTRIELRSEELAEGKEYYPCIVLTGLGYDNIVGADAIEALREFRDGYIEAPEAYCKYAPLTYGVHDDTNDDEHIGDENKGDKTEHEA